MDHSPVALDLVLMLVLCVIYPVADAAWFHPRFIRAAEAGRPDARQWWYAVTIAMTWAFTGVVAALWVAYRRPWTALHLVAVRPLGLALGLGLSVLYAGAMWAQMRALFARPDGRARFRRAFARASAMLPRTAGERWGFALTALTAGICEEVLYRGYVMWFCAVWTGPIAAVVLSSALFGAGHLYLGATHVVRAGLVGLVLATIVVATGSLWPAIILHAVIDLVAGEMGYMGLRDQDTEANRSKYQSSS